jgi:hypothetical protein
VTATRRRTKAMPDGYGGPAKRATTVVNLKGRVHENGGQCPEGVVYIGRRMTRRLGGWDLPESKWANPFKIDTPGRPGHGTREEALARYREHVLLDPELRAALPELRGEVLGCWCTPLPCHGGVLAALADAGEEDWGDGRGEAAAATGLAPHDGRRT